jgi:tRNA(adenine34) deaminase
LAGVASRQQVCIPVEATPRLLGLATCPCQDQPVATYDDLGAPWRLAVDQAWESHVAGSLGIGAVITDRSGAVVSAGRNRSTESTGPSGHLYGTRLAHAEMDALAGLPTDQPPDLTLWTTLEPCLLCAGGIVLCNIAVVQFAASDPLWSGTERVDGLNDFLSSRWPERSGPVDGPLATFGALLPLLWFLRTRGEDSTVAQTYARADPRLLDRARTVRQTAAALAAAQASSQDAFAALAPGLPH